MSTHRRTRSGVSAAELTTGAVGEGGGGGRGRIATPSAQHTYIINEINQVIQQQGRKIFLQNGEIDMEPIVAKAYELKRDLRFHHSSEPTRVSYTLLADDTGLTVPVPRAGPLKDDYDEIDSLGRLLSVAAPMAVRVAHAGESGGAATEQDRQMREQLAARFGITNDAVLNDPALILKQLVGLGLDSTSMAGITSSLARIDAVDDDAMADIASSTADEWEDAIPGFSRYIGAGQQPEPERAGSYLGADSVVNHQGAYDCPPFPDANSYARAWDTHPLDNHQPGSSSSANNSALDRVQDQLNFGGRY